MHDFLRTHRGWVIWIVLSLLCGRTCSVQFGRLRSPAKTPAQLDVGLSLLDSQRFVIWPDFLERGDLAELYTDLESRYESGEMREAAVKGKKLNMPLPYGGPQQRAVMGDIRVTSTCWLDYLQPQTTVEGRLLQFLDGFREQVGAYVGEDLCMEDTEVLYARYPVGGFYKQHCDSHFPAAGVADRDTERRLSFVLYVNEQPWVEGDGGELRMYGMRGQLWPEHVDVAPVPGTLLLFFSRGFEHEVLPTLVSRRAVVGWFRVRAPIKPALPPFFSSPPSILSEQ